MRIRTQVLFPSVGKWPRLQYVQREGNDGTRLLCNGEARRAVLQNTNFVTLSFIIFVLTFSFSHAINLFSLSCVYSPREYLGLGSMVSKRSFTRELYKTKNPEFMWGLIFRQREEFMARSFSGSDSIYRIQRLLRRVLHASPWMGNYDMI